MDRRRLERVAEALADGRGPPALDRLVLLCADMLGVSGATVSLITDGQHRGAIAVTDDAHAAVDDLQFSLGEGPCIDGDRTLGPILEPDLARAAGRWPAFAPAALRRGVRAVHSFPLRVGGVHVGVLNLYRDTVGDLDRTDFADALALARIATHLVLELQSGLPRGALPARLADVLDDRAVVHQAAGMIAAQTGGDVADALSRLRARAWALGRPIHDIASDVVSHLIRFDEEGT